MKNLTRVLALVLALSMVLGTVAFASFTDVVAGDDYAEAIETLAALGIIKGYEDGSFGGDKAITRAEAVAIVNRIQGLQKAAEGAGTVSLYTDVPADHWAIGDINLATQMGIVSGDGDGKFRPNDQVSYQEMVKMLTCAVNYQPAVADLGGWPTGYLVMAQSNGILDDTTNMGAAPANRAIVAQLTYNTISAPLMVQTTYGTDKYYHVNEEGRTLLTEKLKIYKVDAEVTGTDVVDSIEVGYANITVTDKVEDMYDLAAAYRPDDLFRALTQKVAVGNSTIREKKGYQVVAYLQKNDDREWEVLYNTVKEGTNIEITFATSDIEEIKTVNGKTYIVAKDDADVESKYYIDVNATADSTGSTWITPLFVNGEARMPAGAITLADFNYSANDRLDGNVTLLYLDKNDEFVSKVFVERWETDVVSEISPAGTTIFLKNDLPIVLDAENNKDLVYSLTLDGKEIAITDLKEGDVVTYISAKNNNYYNILVSRDTVEGTVDAYYSDDNIYNISGTEYEVSNSAVAVAGAAALKLTGAAMAGNTGIFSLDAFGKLAGFQKVSGSKGAINYGYIVGSFPQYKGFGWDYTLKMLSKDGLKEVKVADKVGVITVSYNAAASELVTSTRVDYKIAESDAAGNIAVGNSKNAFDAIIGAVQNNHLIDYALNSDGEIALITYWPGAAVANTDGENDEITYNAITTAAQYNERNSTIAGIYGVNEDTVVFYVGANDMDDYTVTDASFLLDEDQYADATHAMKVYGADVDRAAGALLITMPVTSAAARENVAVFVRAATVNNEDGISVTQVSYYKNGELQTINGDTTYNMSAYKIGDVMSITTNTKGEMVGVANLTTNGTITANINYPAVINNTPYYVYGQVYGRSGNTLKIGTMPGTAELWENHTVDADTKVYIVERKANGKNAITVGTINDITRNMYYDEKDANGVATGAKKIYDLEQAPNFLVVLKYINGDILDVVAYKNFINPTTQSLFAR